MIKELNANGSWLFSKHNGSFIFLVLPFLQFHFMPSDGAYKAILIFLVFGPVEVLARPCSWVMSSI
jgi:hypothetical protein